MFIKSKVTQSKEFRVNAADILDLLKLEDKHAWNGYINSISVDSRSSGNHKNTLFFAIRGSYNNGHLYLKDAYNKGVRNFVIEEDVEQTLPNANVIKVSSTLEALHKIVTHHRQKHNIPIIGITGSNGKTITKEWIYQMLFKDYAIVKSPKSFNSQTGVPLSVWQIEPKHQMGIFEAGISTKGEMERLEKIIQPHIGIFTNIGSAHSENFKNIGQKVSEKLKLFKNSEVIIYPADCEHITKQIEDDPLYEEKILLNWGNRTNKNTSLQILNISKENDSSKVFLSYENEEINLSIPFTDKGSISSIIPVILLLLYLKIPKNTIAKRVKKLSPIEMKLEQREGINNCTIINDSYNSDLQSIQTAIDFLDHQNNNPNKLLILSELTQHQTDKDSYSSIAQIVNKSNLQKIFGVGKNLRKYKHLFKNNLRSFENHEDIIEYFKQHPPINQTILLKGSRDSEFENISQWLEKKNHSTVLEINLNAIVHNLNFHKKHIKRTTKVMAMVKASSYGNSNHEIAKILQHHRIDYLGVSCIDEGIDLRENGITLPILVLNPEIEKYSKLITYGLEPEIFGFRGLRQMVTLSKKTSMQPFPIHIKIDTGMRRLGFEKDDIKRLCQILGENPQFKIKSIFSHLAESSNLECPEFTKKQIILFNSICNEITSYLQIQTIRHILNSSGIINYPLYQFDMVRLGIGLYGICSDDKIQYQLQNISSLKTTISQIKKIAPDDSVGYGRNFINRSGHTIKTATIPIGYADGICRRLGNQVGEVLVNNQKAKIIGDICMDMLMINVTNIDCKEGDEVIIFNDKLSISEIAKKIDTIPYEIFTNISQRIRRTYVKT